MGVRADERGTAMVEFAIVLPLLLMLVLGIAELGLGFKDDLAISAASRQGARVGSALGRDYRADHHLLEAITTSMAGADPAKIERVLVYDANNPLLSSEYRPGAGCHGWTPCPDPDDPAYDPAAVPWKPGDRVDVISESGPSLTELAVQIDYTHTWVSGFLPAWEGTSTFTETTVMRLEPQVFG